MIPFGFIVRVPFPKPARPRRRSATARRPGQGPSARATWRSLAADWPTLRDRADEEGKSSLWLLHNENAGEVALVTIIDRVSEKLVGELDYLTLNALESATSYGNDWHWGNRIFDRSHWVFTVWFPNTGDSSDKPPLWPNSPPLPAPDNIASEKSVA